METTEIRKLMALAMSDKTFEIRLKSPNGIYSGDTFTITGTLELEGSFAVIREWSDTPKVLQSIQVYPADLIISIKWQNTLSNVVPMQQGYSKNSIVA